MKLIHPDGTEVKVGDIVQGNDLVNMQVMRVDKPHKPSSTGRVYVMPFHQEWQSYFPGVFNLTWINREDRDE